MNVLPGLYVTGVGDIYKDATFHPINENGGWCNYSLRMLRRSNDKIYMVYYCKQWLSLNSPLVTLITSGRSVMISGCWEVNQVKQTDGTTTVYNTVTVTQLVFLENPVKDSVKKERKLTKLELSGGEESW